MEKRFVLRARRDAQFAELRSAGTEQLQNIPDGGTVPVAQDTADGNRAAALLRLHENPFLAGKCPFHAVQNAPDAQFWNGARKIFREDAVDEAASARVALAGHPVHRVDDLVEQDKAVNIPFQSAFASVREITMLRFPFAFLIIVSANNLSSGLYNLLHKFNISAEKGPQIGFPCLRA